MDFINLAHGVQYHDRRLSRRHLHPSSPGFSSPACSWPWPAAFLFGLLLEFLIFRHLYDRDHLDQVLATFGVILILHEGVRILWGAAPISIAIPEAVSGSVPVLGQLRYPLYRLLIIAAGIAVAAGLYLFVQHTRMGMLLRAGASNAPMVQALGVDIRRLFMLIFGVGAMLAGFAGALIAPILSSVEPNMGGRHPDPHPSW